MKARALKLAMIILLSITGSSKAQPVYSVQRRERPPIDIESISEDAYEPGMIRIKVYPHVKSSLTELHEKGEQPPFVKTGHNDFDMLNRTFEVSRYTQAISSLYLADTNSEKFTERHKAWGLDLWYELKLDSKADVISAVKQFTDLKDVEIAELVFKKQLVADDPDFYQKKLKEGQPNGRSDCWTPNDTQYSNQWHYSNFGQQGGTPGADISLEEAWGLEKGNPAVIVAIIDGGIQYDHQDLAANMWPGTGFNFVTNTSSISPHNHGTHVAGTVAAVSNNSVGVAGIAGGSGLADGVKLMSCQVFSNSGNGGFHLAPIFAADNGAAISQNSWGYTSAGVYEQLVLDAIDYFNANGGGSALEGGLTIFAAGNGNSSGQWYPACYPGVFSVAATNNQDVKAWYSNFDTWVDISAPGGETNSVPSRGVLSTLTNNTYGYYQGTSMACPHVSGVAALIVSSAYGLLTAADVSEILRNSADDHYDANPLYAGNLGAGRLNAYAALIETQNMLNGVMNPVSFTAQAISINKISLNWSPNVNDHDVMIAWSQDGVFGEPEEATQYFPGQLIPGGGNVVYRGSGCSFLHEGLQTATMYYYKIWSFNGIDKYSAGRAAHAITQCESENLLPFNENFDVCTSMPICWDVADNIGNGQVWMFGVFTGKVAGTTGNVAFVNSSTYGYGNSQNTDLITPTLDLTNYQNVRLKFKHYFRQYQSASIASVSYSLDNGSTWTNIQTWSTTSANPSIFNMIIPDIAGQSEVRIKWNYSGTWGYFWSIDDVEILGTYSPPPPVPDFFADQTITNLGNSVNFISNVGTQIISSYEWDFGEGAYPQIINGQGPHEVLYLTPGYKTVSLTIDNAYTEIKHDYIQVKDLFTFTLGIEGPGSVLVDNLPYSSPLLVPEGTTIVIQAEEEE
ncbi:MAG: S8 family serine peptidase, partial [Lentimicrobium sp.]|nr:S8 family serine peptidase [Lentimicrobium sp.]